MCAYCEVLDPARQGQDKVLHGQIDVSCPVRGDRSSGDPAPVCTALDT